MLLYTLTNKPFVDRIQQIVMVINEALLFIAAVLLYAIQTLTGDAQDSAGSTFIAVFAIFLFINVCRLVYEIVRSCRSKPGHANIRT